MIFIITVWIEKNVENEITGESYVQLNKIGNLLANLFAYSSKEYYT